MPARPEALELTDRYHRAVDGLGERISQLVVGRFNAMDRAQLGIAFQAFVQQASALIELGQDRAAALARGYLRAFGRIETGETPDADPLEENAGFTADGRQLAEGLSATPAKVFAALKAGRSLDEALAFGRFSAARFALTETIDGARLETAHQLRDTAGIRGWRWRSRGTCAACMAMDDGGIRDVGQDLPAHPNCVCVQEPVFDVKETVQRATGHERFQELAPAVQAAVIGQRRAELLRAGAIAWSDLFTTQGHKEWREVVTVRPVQELEQLAGVAS